MAKPGGVTSLGHAENGDVVTKALKFNVEGQRKKIRSKRTW